MYLTSTCIDVFVAFYTNVVKHLRWVDLKGMPKDYSRSKLRKRYHALAKHEIFSSITRLDFAEVRHRIHKRKTIKEKELTPKYTFAFASVVCLEVYIEKRVPNRGNNRGDDGGHVLNRGDFGEGDFEDIEDPSRVVH